MDFSKQFDTIPHQLLIAKSRAFGIDDRSCALLLDRQDAACKSRRDLLGLDVRKKGRASGQRSCTNVLQLVRQRSILSHKNNETEYIYADHGQLYASDTNPRRLEERMLREVEIANSWFHRNGN